MGQHFIRWPNIGTMHVLQGTVHVVNVNRNTTVIMSLSVSCSDLINVSLLVISHSVEFFQPKHSPIHAQLYILHRPDIETKFPIFYFGHACPK